MRLVLVAGVSWGFIGAAAAPADAAAAAPAAPSITSAPASPGNDRTPTWSFTTKKGTTTDCELTRDGIVVSPLAPCASPTTYDLNGQPDGAYTFSVRAIDAGGRESGTATSAYVLDTTAPATPTITSAPVSPSDSTSPAWEFAAEPGTTTSCQLTRGGKEIFAYEPCRSPRVYDLSGQSDGVYTFSVRASDGAGGVSPAATSTYELASGTPAAPTITSAPASPGTNRFPTWSFTTNGGGTTCQLSRGATVIVPFAPCASPTTYDLTGQPDGTYTFSVRVPSSGASGRVGATATSNYTLANPPGTASSGSSGTTTSSPGATSGGSTEATAEPQAGPRPDSAPATTAPGLAPGGEPASASAPWVGSTGGEVSGGGDWSSPLGAEGDPVGTGGAAASTSGRGGGDDSPGDAGPDETRERRSFPPSLSDFGEVGLETFKETLKKSSFPLLLLLIVVLFLMIQDRIDRSDPKLALAPVYAEPDLGFTPAGPAGEDAR